MKWNLECYTRFGATTGVDNDIVLSIDSKRNDRIMKISKQLYTAKVSRKKLPFKMLNNFNFNFNVNFNVNFHLKHSTAEKKKETSILNGAKHNLQSTEPCCDDLIFVRFGKYLMGNEIQIGIPITWCTCSFIPNQFL